MTLGIGGATPYAQGTNYHTASNHRFRDESPYEVSAQQRMKCPSCGIWGMRGGPCTLCGTKIPGSAACFMKNAGKRSTSPSASRRAVATPGSPRVGTTPRMANGRPVTPIQSNRTPRAALGTMDHNTTPTHNAKGNGNQQPQHPKSSGVPRFPQETDDRVRSLSEAFEPDFDRHWNRQATEGTSRSASDSSNVYQDWVQQQQEKVREYRAQNERSTSANSSMSFSYNPRSKSGASAGSSGSTTAKAKVKCNYCGIWVGAGKICSLCRTPN